MRDKKKLSPYQKKVINQELPGWQKDLKDDMEYDIQKIVDDYLEEYPHVEIDVIVNLVFKNDIAKRINGDRN